MFAHLMKEKSKLTQYVIRLETVRRLQEVTLADVAEHECGCATGSRGLIGPKKRQNTKSNRIFGGQISASIFGVFGCFFLRLSVCPSVIPAQLSDSLECLKDHRGWIAFRPILRTPRPAEINLVQLVWAFGSGPRDPGSFLVGDVFSYFFDFFGLLVGVK